MTPLAPRIGLLFTSFPSASLRFFIHHCKLVPSLDFSKSSSYSPRRGDEQSRNVKVSVWWDIENCTLPVGINALRVSYCIADAVRVIGIKGPIHITAFGDIMALSRSNQDALSSTGINLTHVPHGTAGRNSADRSLLVDLMCWVSQNPPPAHIFLISGDRDFANILHRLRMNNYNILLACFDSAPAVLCNAASIMWPWSALVKGQNPSGKILNQPPDGLYNSWYGQYNILLKDTPHLKQSSFSCDFEMDDSRSDFEHSPVLNVSSSEFVSEFDFKLLSTIDNSASDTNKKSNSVNDFPIKNDLMCKESFWDDLGLFLETPKGADIVSNSKNRKELASALRKHGPAVLEKIDTLHLVHLLLTDKKWLRENSSSSQTWTFQLVRNGRIGDSESRVTELLRDHPKGFLLSRFKDIFSQKYGYILDYKTLGHRKLISFLRLIPGISVRSNYIRGKWKRR